MLAFLSVVIIIGAISIIFPKLDVAIAQSDDLLYDDWEDCIATQTEEFCRRSGFRPPWETVEPTPTNTPTPTATPTHTATPTSVPPTATHTPVPPPPPPPPPEPDYANWQDCFDATNDATYCDGLFPPTPTPTPTPTPLPRVEAPVLSRIIGMNHANLSWTVPEGAESYIWRYRRAPQAWVEEQTTATSATAIGLISHSGYQFQVAAFGDGITHSQEMGEWSEVKSSITSLAPKPTRPVEAGKTLDSVTVSWRNISGTDSYQLKTFATLGPTAGEWVEHSARSILTYGDRAIGTADGLLAEHSYSVMVRLIGDGITYVRSSGGGVQPGEWSAATVVITKTRPPANLQGTATRTGNLPTIELEWTGRSHISRYKVGYIREDIDGWEELGEYIRGNASDVRLGGFYCETGYRIGLSAISSITGEASDYAFDDVDTKACGMEINYHSTDPSHSPAKDVLIEIEHSWTRSYASGVRFNTLNWHEAFVTIRGYRGYNLLGKYADDESLSSKVWVGSELVADIVWGDWQGPSFPNIEEYKFGGRYAYGPGATYRGSKNAYASTKWSVAINERASPLTPAIRFHGTHSYSLLWHSM